MTELELLAPARNADVGIAAVDCGADAVYIAGPSFGARKDAGNPISEVGRLCSYAHRFGVKVFLTVNIELRDDEMDSVHSLMLEAQDAGVDAFIIRDMRIALWKDILVPLHASTQCAVRTPQRARELRDSGCERIVLERQLTLAQIKEICDSAGCGTEVFVHGALCVGYSGECVLSEHIDGRSADRGECIQACRSLYDLVTEDGRTLVRNKALLSLKDYNLKNRLEELCEAGAVSFKIEGRLKNSSYVKNVVRDYSDAMDEICRKYPDRYRRVSWGHPEGGFTPDTGKTFNRGYTELFLDGKRGEWSSMDCPKSMGEAVGRVISVSDDGNGCSRIRLKTFKDDTVLRNGDGFAFSNSEGITGFRADRAGNDGIVCRRQAGLKIGDTLYRNVNGAFEKELENNLCRRFIPVSVTATIGSKLVFRASDDRGRTVETVVDNTFDKALNGERSLSILKSCLSKKSDIYSFTLTGMQVDGDIPVLSASFVNSIRNQLAGKMSAIPYEREKRQAGVVGTAAAVKAGNFLLKSKYCVKYELGLCRKHFSEAPDYGKLFLLNNGRRYALEFDCAACEMSVTPVRK